MIPKMFVWAPVKAAQLRDYLIDEDDEIRSVVLVPLEVGTAIVFAEPVRLRYGTCLAEVAREKSGTTLVMFIWNDQAASVNPVAKSLMPGWDWGTDEARFQLYVRPDRFGIVATLLFRFIDYLHTSRSSRAKQARAARRIAQALQAPEDIVRVHVRDWENGRDVVVDLLDAVGKTDLARVARQVDADAYAFWDGTRKLPIVTLDRD